MSRTWISFFLLAPALIALAPSAIWADYLTQTYSLDGQTVAGGVQVEAYDGNGPAGGGLGAGQVRLTFTAVGLPLPPISFDTGLSPSGGLEGVFFASDLNLSVGQISVPTNWGVTDLGQPGTFGAYFAGPATDLQSAVSVLISGLGANATLNHFQPDARGGYFVQWQWDYPLAAQGAGEGVIDTLEPSTLTLGSLGLAALVGQRLRRRFAL